MTYEEWLCLPRYLYQVTDKVVGVWMAGFSRNLCNYAIFIFLRNGRETRTGPWMKKVWGKLKHGRKWNMGIWCLNKFNEMDLWDKSERESYLDKCHWSRLEASTTSWDWQSLQRLLFKWSKPLTSISDGAQVRILFLFFIKFLESQEKIKHFYCIYLTSEIKKT